MSFADFIQDEPEEVAEKLRKQRKLSSIKTWAALRSCLKALYGGEEKLVEARQVWQRYQTILKG